MSPGTWAKIEDRKKTKDSVNNAKTRQQKNEANKKYQEKDREVKQHCRKDKRNYVNQLATEAEEAAYRGDIKTLYNITKTLSNRRNIKVKPVKDKDGKTLTKLEEQMERWNEHFKSVLNRPEPDEPIDIEPGEELNIRTEGISRNEIKIAIKSLKSGKASGIDEIPAEALKAGGNDIIEYLWELLNKIWNQECIPSEWKKGLLVKLAKKGDLSNCGNWRGITLLTTTSKVLSRIILNRIKHALDKTLREEQAGFRQNRSCVDQIATLRIIVEQSIEWQSSLYINFIDFEKAFDSINRDGMWKLLRHYGLPIKIVNMIKALYEEFSVQVIHDSNLTEPFQVTTGVKQGCLLSPTLFLIVIDWVTRQAFDSKRGIQWTMVTNLEDLDFADDLALLSHRIKDMRDKTEKLYEKGRKIGLKVNIKKTKIMKVMTRKSGAISVQNEDIEEVDQFTYLGSIISKTGGTEEDINARISKGRQAFAMLKPIWNSKVISENTKIRIFNTNVKSVLLYGSETWRLTKGLQHKIQVFLNKCLRWICRVWWPQTISNKNLYIRTKQDPVIEEIRKRSWQWIGHTLRKPDVNITKQALEWNPQGNRRQGRPTHSWRRTRLKELERTGTTWREAKQIAQNRVRWRTTVSALCSIRDEED